MRKHGGFEFVVPSMCCFIQDRRKTQAFSSAFGENQGSIPSADAVK